jgi:F-type H+-transporting ATPase subunit epsilon
MRVALVSAEREVWSGTATMVLTRTTEGDIGLLPGHEPLLAILATGTVTIRSTEGETVRGAVHGGFLAVSGDEVSILAEIAELGVEVDVARAQRALDRAASQDSPELQAAHKRARARLLASGHLHG